MQFTSSSSFNAIYKSLNFLQPEEAVTEIQEK